MGVVNHMRAGLRSATDLVREMLEIFPRKCVSGTPKALCKEMPENSGKFRAS